MGRWTAALLAIGGAIGLLAGLIAGANQVLWYFEDDRLRNINWLAQDEKWNAEQLGKLDSILQRQDEIQSEMATQSLLLGEVRETQKRRFEELEQEHKWLVNELNAAVRTMAIELGRVSERHRGLPARHP